MERRVLTAVGVVLAAVGGWALSASTNRSSDPLPPLSAISAPTVVVPVLRSTYTEDYIDLHRLGLRVTIPHGFAYGPNGPSDPAGSDPPAGTRVPAGSTVRLVGRGAPIVSNPVIMPGPLPSAIVPQIAGRRASVALTWVERHKLEFAAHLGPLQAGDAPTLFANYRITRQDPRPGKRLALGTDRILTKRTAGISLTPLTVWARQASG